MNRRELLRAPLLAIPAYALQATVPELVGSVTYSAFQRVEIVTLNPSGYALVTGTDAWGKTITEAVELA